MVCLCVCVSPLFLRPSISGYLCVCQSYETELPFSAKCSLRGNYRFMLRSGEKEAGQFDDDNEKMITMERTTIYTTMCSLSRECCCLHLLCERKRERQVRTEIAVVVCDPLQYY